MIDGGMESYPQDMASWRYALPFDGQNVRFVARQGWVGGIWLTMGSLPDDEIVVAMVSIDPDTHFNCA